MKKNVCCKISQINCTGGSYTSTSAFGCENNEVYTSIIKCTAANVFILIRRKKCAFKNNYIEERTL